MSQHPIIGSKYTGPSFDRPALRQMPKHLTLEETRREHRVRWYQQTSTWLSLAVALLFLIACAETVKALM